MKTICILNHKGGVGKTTSVLNIGAGLALKGHRTLLIDLDPQGNLSQGLGHNNGERTIYDSLTGRFPLAPEQVSENLFICPSSGKLTDFESEFSTKIGGQVRLRKLLSDVQGFEFCLIDCPPSLGLLSINAMTASQGVLVPLTPQFFSLQGILSLTQAINDVQETLNPNLSLTGLLITQYNSQKIVHREFSDVIEGRFGDKVFRTRIRPNVAIEESPNQRTDIFNYAPKSNGATDYRSVVEELLERM